MSEPTLFSLTSPEGERSKIGDEDMKVQVLTIGYGGKHPTDFFKELEDLKADLVIDVRRDPHHAFLGVYTYKPLFVRIRGYVWIQELGNKRKTLPPELIDEGVGLGKAIGMIVAMKAKRVVLLCAEKDEDRCHRKYVKEKLETLLEKTPLDFHWKRAQ